MALLQKIVFVLALINVACSAKIKFYDSLNFTGLFYEINSSPSGCVSVPEYGLDKTVSIITDTCIILHDESSCQSVNSMKLNKGEYDNLAQLGFGNKFNGFQFCNATEGGDQLDVDLYYSSGYRDLAVKYSDVCGCIDMPNFVGTRHIVSVNNHGNCIKLHEEIGCSGKDIELLGGHNAKTRNLAIYFGYPTRSISSCEDNISCLNLQAKIFKFELSSTANESFIMSNSLDFEMASKTSFFNNGSATVTQEYHASKKIVESMEIFRSRSLTEMSRVELEVGIEFEVWGKVSYFFASAGASVKTRFNAAFTMETNTSYTESEKYFSEETREVSVSQTIQIMPCSTYEVSSIVKVIEDYPVDYVAYARISGEYAGLRMTTATIKDKISGMEVVGDEDDFTVIAKTTGKMTADFGMETKISGEGAPIPGCQVQNNFKS